MIQYENFYTDIKKSYSFAYIFSSLSLYHFWFVFNYIRKQYKHKRIILDEQIVQCRFLSMYLDLIPLSWVTGLTAGCKFFQITFYAIQDIHIHIYALLYTHISIHNFTSK